MGKLFICGAITVFISASAWAKDLKIPAGGQPAETAAPGEKFAEPAAHGNKAEPVKPDAAAKPDKAADPEGAKPGEPAAQGKNGQPPDETPSGTKPAEPAVPGESPAKPAEPGEKDKDAKEKEEKKEKKDKKEKGGKNKGGKSGKSSGVNLPSVPAAPAAAGALGVVPLGGGKDKKENPVAQPAKEVSTAAAVSPAAVPAEPAYSQGEGPSIVVLDFEGEKGAEFAGLLAGKLQPGRKVYSRKALAEKNYGAEVTRVSAKKIAAETGAEYLVAGKLNKKTETLYVVSVLLRDGASGDVKSTNFINLRNMSELSQAALSAGDIVAAELEKLKK